MTQIHPIGGDVSPHANRDYATTKTKRGFSKVYGSTNPVFWGLGARGGGKSYLVRAREVYRRLKFPGTKGLIVRKTYPELLSNHIRMFWKEYPSTNGWFHKGEKAIYWPNGSITEFSYLKSTDDVYTYQGREYEDISIDEITQHEEDVFKILRASNRTTNPEIKPTMILTGNPGGIGHGWCKRLFVDRNFHEDEDPKEYAFVQSKVRDNRALMEADPDYIKRLQALPDDRRRAWLDGDWDVFSGQVFGEFRRDTHVINPLTPNSSFKHYFGMDWGYSEKAAFSCHASAVIPMKAEDGQVFNRVVTYQEWYGNQKYPDEWAGIIFKEARNRKFIRGYTDPSMHNPQSDGSVPLARIFDRLWTRKNRGTRWCFLDKGSRNRIARVATVHNWLSLAPDGLPYWLITSDCVNLIRTLPLLVYDEHRVEDVDTSQEDHAFDDLGYFLSQIKWISATVGSFGGKRSGGHTMQALPMMPVSESGDPLSIDTDAFAITSRRAKDWRAI